MLEAHQPQEPDLHGIFIEPQQSGTGWRGRLKRPNPADARWVPVVRGTAEPEHQTDGGTHVRRNRPVPYDPH